MATSKWKQLAVALLVCGWFGFWGIGSVTFIDPDEGMYGTIAWEMAGTGDWVTARFNGVRYLNKPPLLFWLSALTFKIFGPAEWGVRLWSALPVFGTALLLWLLGTRLYGSLGGFFSALVFSSSLGVFLYAHVTLTDPLLIFSTCLSITAAVCSGSDKAAGSRVVAAPLLFYLALSLGVLAKGLVAVLLPGMTLGVFSIWQRESGKAIFRGLLVDRYALPGVLLFFLLTTPWHFLAAQNNPGFVQYYLLDNQLLRYFKSGSLIEDDISVTTPMFLLLSLVWFLPWAALIPAVLRHAVSQVRDARSADDGWKLLPLIWAVVIVLFFSLSSSKLEHYSLPALPALSLMTGGWWAERLRAPRRANIVARYAAPGIFLIALCGSMLLFWQGAPDKPGFFNALPDVMGYYRAIQTQGFDFPFAIQPLAALIYAVALALLLGISGAALCLTLDKVWASFFVFLLTSAGIFLLLFRIVLLLEPYHSTRALADAVLARARPQDLLLHEEPLEYSGGLAFYTGKRILIVNGKRGSLEFGSRYPDAREIFLDTEELARLWRGGQRLFLVTRFPPERSAIHSLPQETVRPLGRFGARWLYSNRD